MDRRNNSDTAAVQYFIIGSFAIMFALFVGSKVQNGPVTLYMFNNWLSAEMIEDSIRDLREQNQALENRRDELKEQLA